MTPPFTASSLQLLSHSMLDDAADELEVVGGAADCGVHAGPDEGADGREARGQRHAVIGVISLTGGSVEGIDWFVLSHFRTT